MSASAASEKALQAVEEAVEAMQTSDTVGDGLTNAELKERLRAQGLPVSGNKAELVARLEGNQAGESDDEASEAGSEAASEGASQGAAKEASQGGSDGASEEAASKGASEKATQAGGDGPCCGRTASQKEALKIKESMEALVRRLEKLCSPRGRPSK